MMVNDNYELFERKILVYEYDYKRMKWSMFLTGIFCGAVSTAVGFFLYNQWLSIN